MDNNQKEILAKVGVKWEEELRRFCENEELYVSFLLKFEQDPYYQILKDALNKDQFLEAFEAGHTLKGVAGNLGLGDLYRESGIIVEKLRPINKITGTETMDELGEDIISQFKDCKNDMIKLEEVYTRTIEAIKKIQ
ncbi:MAG: Hpt domain-containing protein [Clostridia bacterium]|nr:Hpt domain-containing protein [Clostridia bacterium]